MNMDKVRLGIIGVGNMGTSHAQNVTAGKVPHMELTALCDVAEVRKNYCKETYPDIAFFDTSESLSAADLLTLC